MACGEETAITRDPVVGLGSYLVLNPPTEFALIGYVDNSGIFCSKCHSRRGLKVEFEAPMHLSVSREDSYSQLICADPRIC